MPSAAGFWLASDGGVGADSDVEAEPSADSPAPGAVAGSICRTATGPLASLPGKNASHAIPSTSVQNTMPAVTASAFILPLPPPPPPRRRAEPPLSGGHYHCDGPFRPCRPRRRI